MEKDLHLLLARYLDGECSETELRRLYEHFGHPENDGALVEAIRLYMTQHVTTYDEEFSLADEIADRAFHRVMKATKPKKRLRWLRYAAAVILLSSVIGYFVIDRHMPPVDNFATTEISPGSNRAILTLADGRKIDLSSGQAGIVVADDITYLDGTTVFSHTSEGRMSESSVAERHLPTIDSRLLTLTTPKGGTYSITLPDGSRAWLNAASTLKYPSRFSEDAREIILEGEAYFEVKEERIAEQGSQQGRRFRPFKVRTAGQTIEVLGTEFNVSAYADDSEIQTTLVEGKVKVSIAESNVSNILYPGQQAVMQGTAIDVREVDTEPYTSWKSGKFSFDGKPFVKVMDEVSRWYDLEVVYVGGKPNGQLVGDAYRNQNLSIVLGMLDVLEINYKLDIPERKLTIYYTEGGQP